MSNRISREWAENEVGKDQLAYIFNDFHHWLFRSNASEEDIAMRLAPSIMARGECELFAVSAPRFAVRAKFRDGSFANLRRLGFLEQTVKDYRWGEKSPNSAERFEFDQAAAKQFTPSQAVAKAKGRPVADGFLVPQEQILDNFHVLTTKLMRAYGECLSEADDKSGVPFAQHINLGGGLCAQAVCFAATALLHEYSNGIYGVSEISALAVADDLTSSQTIPLGGLAERNICNYFTKVGLNCHLQTPGAFHCKVPQIAKARWYVECMTQFALRAYVMSDMPVIALVDAALLEPVYQRVNLEIPAGNPAKILRHHAVLIVGCGKSPRSTSFLMNDPSHYPFVPIGGIDIINARAQIAEMSGDTVVVSQPETRFCAVVPSDVRMGLLFDLTKMNVGLYTHSSRISKDAEQLTSVSQDVRDALQFDANSCFNPGECFLLPKDMDKVQHVLERAIPDDPECVALIESIRRNENLPSWLWLQIRKATSEGSGRYSSVITLWDATRNVKGWSEPDQVFSLVEMIMVRPENSSWQILWRAANHAQPEITRNVNAETIGSVNSHGSGSREPCQKPGPLRLSLISSFSGERLGISVRRACRSWPAGVEKNIDVYAHMQTDVPREYPPGTTAADYLASCVNDEQALDAEADRISNLCRGQFFKIPALASFLPTLAFSVQDDRAKTARRAVVSLVKLALRIGARQGQAVHAIEIVCGSRITGVWPAIDTLAKSRPGLSASCRLYTANMLSDEDARHNIISNLRLIVREMLLLEHGGSLPYLALETEPGPLFAIRDWSTLLSLMKMINGDEALSQMVGINLDISHFILAGIRPESVQANPEIMDAVVHAHISGHHRRAHLGDIPLFVLNSQHDYQSWLDVLETRCTSSSRLRYSQMVALELEAINSCTWLTDALLDVGKILRGSNETR